MATDNRPDLIRHLEEQGMVVEEVHMDVDDLSIILGTDLGSLVESLLAQATPSIRYPKRNTDEYKQMLQDGINCLELNGVIAGIKQLRDGYGHIGLVDFMATLVRSMEKYAPDQARDAFGMVRIDKILRTDHDEAELMETAVHIANAPGAAEQGFDFGGALEAGLEIVDTVDSWLPHFQNALRAAAQGDLAQVRAALVQLPHLKDTSDEKVSMTTQGVLVLAMAHMAVTRPQHVLDQWEKQAR